MTINEWGPTLPLAASLQETQCQNITLPWSIFSFRSGSRFIVESVSILVSAPVSLSIRISVSISIPLYLYTYVSIYV